MEIMTKVKIIIGTTTVIPPNPRLLLYLRRAKLLRIRIVDNQTRPTVVRTEQD